MAAAPDMWQIINHQHLTAAIGKVRAALVRHVDSRLPAADGKARPAKVKGAAGQDDEETLAGAVAALPMPPALESVYSRFALSPFERDILLLCAGVELDAGIAALCAAAQDDSRRNYATFALALAALPAAHWSAVTPVGPLRRWRLIHVEEGGSLVYSPLRIAERVLHYLEGVDYLDEHLEALLHPLAVPVELAPSHRAAAQRIAAIWRQAAANGSLPIVHLRGHAGAAKWEIAAEACAAVGLALYRLPISAVPAAAPEIEHLIRLWEREALLSGCALLIDADEQTAAEVRMEGGLARLLAAGYGPVIFCSRERRPETPMPLASFDIGKPTSSEQRQLWQATLGAEAAQLDGQLEQIIAQFDLDTGAIRSAWATAQGQTPAAGQAAGQAAGRKTKPEAQEDRRQAARQSARPAAKQADQRSQQILDAIWDACRIQARPQLDDLAQRIEPAATMDKLILPATQCEILREIMVQVRRRRQVYEDGGFATQSGRGLGISALFVGASGAGKTMAAEVLACELRLDLYRIDLSTVVSKYIGETEKNLRRIFDAAESGCAILLFDEADALFGKRSQVKDSHDRYANIEVSYLLQRMEVYRGLAILTTNMKDALDNAFLRRLRFVVQFPFPDAAQRDRIWRHAFPKGTRTKGLDRTKLARLNIGGGNIRNIALNAAFLAADNDEPVQMRHILRAAQREYAKLERTLTAAETQGWDEK